VNRLVTHHLLAGGTAGAAPCLLLIVLGLAGCGPAGPTAQETIESFVEAVQSQDLDALYCLMAGASQAEELGKDDLERRAGFESWALALYESYLRGRDEGWVDLDPQGLALVKLFALGRGTFFVHTVSRSTGPDVRVIRSEVRFGYANVDLSVFSPGTTFYVCGPPVGRVHAIRVPAEPEEIAVEVLATVQLEWTLLRTPPGGGACNGRWAVASLSWVEDSVQSTEVTWVF
jgi:hypothetical protein